MRGDFAAITQTGLARGQLRTQHTSLVLLLLGYSTKAPERSSAPVLRANRALFYFRGPRAGLRWAQGRQLDGNNGTSGTAGNGTTTEPRRVRGPVVNKKPKLTLYNESESWSLDARQEYVYCFFYLNRLIIIRQAKDGRRI